MRGLKHEKKQKDKDTIESHPSWVRGLKPLFMALINILCPVAPLVGAWIETCNDLIRVSISDVAPLVGAWIETSTNLTSYIMKSCRTPRGCVD